MSMGRPHGSCLITSGATKWGEPRNSGGREFGWDLCGEEVCVVRWFVWVGISGVCGEGIGWMGGFCVVWISGFGGKGVGWMGDFVWFG